MRLYAVQSADSAGLTAAGDAGRAARAAAMARRRLLSQGKQAMNGDGTQSGAQNPQANGVRVPPSAHLGRALSMQHRRQLSKGKRALNGSAGAPALVVHRGGVG